MVIVHVPNDVHGSHGKRKHRLHATERGFLGRLALENTAHGNVGEPLPCFRSKGHAAIGQKVGLAFS